MLLQLRSVFNTDTSVYMHTIKDEIVESSFNEMARTVAINSEEMDVIC